MKKLMTTAILKLIRPLNGMIGGVSVFIGGFLTHESIRNFCLFLACLVCFLIISAGNAINDFVDADMDKINKPKRPIPSGKCTKGQVLIISIILFTVGLVISVKLGLQMFIITLIASLLILMYNFNLKKQGISGNLLVAFLGGFPFVYGGIVLGKWVPTLIPFGFAFLLHFAREILKDIEDIPGDKSMNSISFPIKYGVRKATLLSTITLSVLIGVTILPFVLYIYGLPYLIGVILCIDIPLGVIIYKLLKTERYVFSANKLLKFNMVIGLGILALGYYR